MRLTELSVDEIRDRVAAGRLAVSARLLDRLRRDPRAGVRRLHEVLARRFAKERAERDRLDAMLRLERVLWGSGVERVAGVDEVGMGPLAGPVVAAAVVFPPGAEVPGVDDSKKLLPEERAAADAAIRAVAAGIGIGVASVAEVDAVNVYHAGLLAMRRAVEALPAPPQHVLVDARRVPGVAAPQSVFTKGDGIAFSIAAASIVAKVRRDALLDALDAEHPGYGFARHKGYATPEHQEAIRRLGPCAAHRRSFGFVGELRGESSPGFYDLRARVAAAGGADDLVALESEVDARSGELGDREHRKLKLLLRRRWDVRSRRPRRPGLPDRAARE